MAPGSTGAWGWAPAAEPRGLSESRSDSLAWLKDKAVKDMRPLCAGSPAWVASLSLPSLSQEFRNMTATTTSKKHNSLSPCNLAGELHLRRAEGQAQNQGGPFRACVTHRLLDPSKLPRRTLLRFFLKTVFEGTQVWGFPGSTPQAEEAWPAARRAGEAPGGR